MTASDYDPAHDLVALGYNDGSFELRRGATETLACGEHRTPISNLTFSPDGAVLVTADTFGCVAASRVKERTTELLLELASEIHGLAFNPKGTLLALSTGPEVVLVQSGGSRVALASLPRAVTALTFTRDGRQLIAAGDRLTFLSVPDLRVERSIIIPNQSSRERATMASDVRLSPDGRKLGVLLLGGVGLLDLHSGVLTVATPSGWNPVGLRFAPDGRIAVFARDRLYVGPADPERLATESFPPAGELMDVEFRRDGRLLVVGGPIDPTIAALIE